MEADRRALGPPPTGKPRSMTGMKRVRETYLSQISEDANTIKIKIRKASAPALAPPPPPPRTRKPRPKAKPPKRRAAKKSDQAESAPAHQEPAVPQGPWGASAPEELLAAIFEKVTQDEGCLPALVRLGQVCRLWHTASKNPALWSVVELSRHTRDKWKTDHRLVWLLENRLTMCRRLNLSDWKVSDLQWVVGRVVESCPGLRELNLSGWKRLGADHLREIAERLPKLSRLDLSRTSETGSSGGCLSAASLTKFAQTTGDRLTHLTLANNRLSGLPTILTAVSTHCPNLELLDLSNLAAVSHPASVPLERLQKGCPRLRVLRITNSQVVLATATPQEQVESPGFPLLEELSVACPSTDYKLVDDEALGRILKSSNCLKLLDVRGCIRITDSGLIKVPAWDLQHLFLSGCCVTRQSTSCLELICEKWSHSLLEVDLAWSTATAPLDAAVEALAERGETSVLRVLNLCGSSVNIDPVRKVLLKCSLLESVNLASCRALPRGMKRLYSGQELVELRDSFDPEKVKKKEELEKLARENKKKGGDKTPNKKSEKKVDPPPDENENADSKDTSKESDVKSPKEDDTVSESEKDETSASIKSPSSAVSSPALVQANTSVRSTEQEDSPQSVQISPMHAKGSMSVHEQSSPQQCSSAISTPKSNHTQDYSPVSRLTTSDMVSASNQYDSDSRPDTAKSSGSGNWNSGQFSPMTKSDGPTSSHPSPDTGNSTSSKHDIQKPGGNWNCGHYSPSVGRHENSPYSSLPSPYPSHVSPDMGQPVNKSNQYGLSNRNLEQFSPALRHESVCSSQPSPETGPGMSRSSQSSWNLESYSPMASNVTLPSPDTSQVTSSGKPCGQWNLDRYSPMARAESSPVAAPSPEAGISSVKSGHWSLGHFSPMARPEMSPVAHQSPDGSSQNVSKSSWNLGHFSPMARQEASPVGHQSSPSGVHSVTPKHIHNSWNIGQYSPMSKVDSSSGTQKSVQSGDTTPNMWDSRNAYSMHDTSLKCDTERTSNCFASVDQVTTTTYCSSSNQVIYSGFSDPLNGPSSVE